MWPRSKTRFRSCFASLKAYNHGQKFWDTFALLVLLRIRQTRILLHLPNLTPHPLYNVKNYYLQFLLIFNVVLGGEGEQ